MKIIILLTSFLCVNILFANSSVYVSLAADKCKKIFEDDHFREDKCKGPKGHAVHVLDGGGMQIQFDIKYKDKSLSVWSVAEPKVVEYRLNAQQEVIGLIMRIFTFKDYTLEDTSKKTSLLYVYSFEKGIKLLGKVKGNKQARALIDK